MTSINKLSSLRDAYNSILNAAQEKENIINQALDLFKEGCNGLDHTRLVNEWRGNLSRDLPYHNNFHQASVTVVADAMWQRIYGTSRPLERAALIIAAMFHDNSHSGGEKADTLNIVTALRNVFCIVPSNLEKLVYEAILSTEFPFVRDPVSDVAKILRDADILACTVCSQHTYYQQYVVGLRKEIEVSKNATISDEEFFTMQMSFLPNIKFFVANEHCNDLMLAYSNIISWNSEWLKDAKAETSEDKEN